jgi:hypothetical protein
MQVKGSTDAKPSAGLAASLLLLVFDSLALS